MDSSDMDIYQYTKYTHSHFKNIYHVQFHVELTCTEK